MNELRCNKQREINKSGVLKSLASIEVGKTHSLCISPTQYIANLRPEGKQKKISANLKESSGSEILILGGRHFYSVGPQDEKDLIPKAFLEKREKCQEMGA